MTGVTERVDARGLSILDNRVYGPNESAARCHRTWVHVRRSEVQQVAHLVDVGRCEQAETCDWRDLAEQHREHADRDRDRKPAAIGSPGRRPDAARHVQQPARASDVHCGTEIPATYRLTSSPRPNSMMNRLAA
jgi:hypothetical protein